MKGEHYTMQTEDFTLSEQEKRIISALRQLNQRGKNEAEDIINDMRDYPIFDPNRKEFEGNKDELAIIETFRKVNDLGKSALLDFTNYLLKLPKYTEIFDSNDDRKNV